MSIITCTTTGICTFAAVPLRTEIGLASHTAKISQLGLDLLNKLNVYGFVVELYMYR